MVFWLYRSRDRYRERPSGFRRSSGTTPPRRLVGKIPILEARDDRIGAIGDVSVRQLEEEEEEEEERGGSADDLIVLKVIITVVTEHTRGYRVIVCDRHSIEA